MCTTCGCGQGETRIEGEHEHEHVHADGTVHSHPHEHVGEHAHAHGAAAGAAHAHLHAHADGTVHSHPHTHEAEHDHGHDAAPEAHEHPHRHADGTVHSHPHTHAGAHAHAHAAVPGAHEHVHAHADGTVHAHPHVHEADHAHGHGGAEDLPALWHRHADGTVHAHHPGGDHAHGDLHFGLGPAGAHAPGLSQARMVKIEQDILAKNDAYARENRRALTERGVFAVNLVSSPGSGKTTLLTRTIEALKGRHPLAVIEGDQQTAFDADRIRATGAPAVQINTGKGCHLDAHMVGRALAQLPLADGGLLFIENVGNLVCPSGFDLGEAHKVVVLSVTEGEDKPLKYPDMFHAARLMLLNKVDLLPYVDFDADQCVEYARRVNPAIEVIRVSATRGEGMEAWLAWLEQGAAAAAARCRGVVSLKERIARLEQELAALKTELESGRGGA
jgi:hydrogenase nickel incorporation protein HypB